MLGQVGPTTVGYRDDPARSDLVPTRDKSTVVGVLPHRQARTRCSPRIKNLGVRAPIGSDPFQEVEDQSFNRVGHEDPIVIVSDDGAPHQTLTPVEPGHFPRYL
jgi:hypothetical protein